MVFHHAVPSQSFLISLLAVDNHLKETLTASDKAWCINQTYLINNNNTQRVKMFKQKAHMSWVRLIYPLIWLGFNLQRFYNVPSLPLFALFPAAPPPSSRIQCINLRQRPGTCLSSDVEPL